MGGSRNRVGAVALVTVFGSSNREAFATTELDALFVGHATGAGACAGKGSVVVVVSTAALITPTRGRKIGEERLALSDSLCVSGTRRDRRYHSRTLSHRIAAWKLSEGTLNIFIDPRSELATLSSGGWVEVENWAVFYSTTEVRALINGSLKQIAIPTHEEISVEAVSRRITHCPDERLAVAIPLVCKCVGVPYDLVENGDEVNWMSTWARSVIVGTDWVRHMRLIWKIEILSVPTRWEEDLRTKTIWTVHIGETTSLRVATLFVVVEAVVADSLRGKVTTPRALEGVASKHSEPFWESLQLVVVWSGSL